MLFEFKSFCMCDFGGGDSPHFCHGGGSDELLKPFQGSLEYIWKHTFKLSVFRELLVKAGTSFLLHICSHTLSLTTCGPLLCPSPSPSLQSGCWITSLLSSLLLGWSSWRFANPFSFRVQIPCSLLSPCSHHIDGPFMTDRSRETS